MQDLNRNLPVHIKYKTHFIAPAGWRGYDDWKIDLIEATKTLLQPERSIRNNAHAHFNLIVVSLECRVINSALA